ncbi:MAG: hypothetical protein ACHQNA_04110 [Acidimicrobiales bacterium]
MVPWPSYEGEGAGELPGYLDERGELPAADLRGFREVLTGAHLVAGAVASGFVALSRAGTVPAGGSGTLALRSASGQPPDLSAGFLRMVKLRGAGLGAMLDEWWTGATDGRVLVHPCLELREPLGGPRGGWSIRGRVKRLASVRWVPVVVDMWPVHDRWTIITMTPQRRVVCSRRYFRAGHSGLDRFTAALAATPAGQVQ